MSARARKRTRVDHAHTGPIEPVDFAELAVLWGKLGAALARDTASADAFTADRHASGLTGGVPHAGNTPTVRAARVIRAGATTVTAQVAAALNLDTTRTRSTTDVLAALPTWWASLSTTHPPVARAVADAAAAWLLLARRAVALTEPDLPFFGLTCPDHRDSWLTGLMQAGAEATLNPSLVAGPPGSDWTSDGRWAGVDGYTPVSGPGAIYCPHCNRRWTSTAERRMLARMAADNGAGRLPTGMLGRITG